MTPQEAVAKLNALGTNPDEGDDNASNHGDADGILLAVLRANGMAEVADAWQEACSRCEFWYS